MLNDGRGIPLDVEVSGANTHDIKLLQATFDSVPVKRPQPTPSRHQHVCLDKATTPKTFANVLAVDTTSPRQVAWAEENAAEKESAFQSSTLGSETNAFLNQSVSPATRPLGEESRQLSGDVTFLVCVVNSQHGGGSGIGSTSPTEHRNSYEEHQGQTSWLRYSS